ncbi:MAG TPA: folate-binding protein [Xanthomonadaceae bacterium]|jgi:folate-binding protein YgfZ|nr:folate-binding protein [Xanthomonadaceae bacterium]
MAHKQDAPSEPFVLPGWQLLEVAGVDAGAFLQAQLMNDVRALAPGHWQWNGWLNPKGRVIALFALITVDERRYWLLVPDFPAADLAARLQRFVFRSKLTIAVREDCAIDGQFAAPEHARRALIHHSLGIDAEDAELDFGADGETRVVRIQARNQAQYKIAEAASQLGHACWLAFDLAHGLPHLPMDQSEMWTPQMLSLDRLNAYSLKKGCYPGQEIVARTHYLGQVKRSLVRIAGTGFQVGADIRTADRVIGSVVSCAGDEALAVLSADRASDNWECAGSPCHELPLAGGLER